MKKCLIFILLFMAAASPASYDYSTIESYATVCDKTPSLNITSFSATPIAPYNDQIVLFETTIKNNGNCYTMGNISMYINVYDSLGANVWNVSRINDSGLTAQSVWAMEFYSTYFAAGDYVANLTIVYTAMNFSGQSIFSNSTNSSVNFSVTVRPPTTTPTPGGGGGGGGIVQPDFLKFKKYPILQEIEPGSLVVVDLTFKNPKDTAQTINVAISGLPPSWLNVFANSITLEAKETKTITLTINVPDNADPGDYLAKADLSGGGMVAQSYFIVRVKKYPDAYFAPKIYRKVNIDMVDNRTDVIITAKNGNTGHKRVEILENIPKVLAYSVSQITFYTPPRAIIKNDPIVSFSFDNFGPKETRTISYVIANVVEEYEPYIYWTVDQVNILPDTGADKVKVSNTYQSILTPGGEENYLTFDIGNVDVRALNVSIDFWLPEDWNCTPSTVYLEIPAYTQTRVNMKLSIPYNAKMGSYYGGLQISYENSTMTKEVVLKVEGASVITGVFGLFDFLSHNEFLIVLLVAALVILTIRTVRKRRYVYKEDVTTTLSEIKGILRRRR